MKLITQRKAAQILGVSEGRVSQFVRDGHLQTETLAVHGFVIKGVDEYEVRQLKHERDDEVIRRRSAIYRLAPLTREMALEYLNSSKTLRQVGEMYGKSVDDVNNAVNSYRRANRLDSRLS